MRQASRHLLLALLLLACPLAAQEGAADAADAAGAGSDAASASGGALIGVLKAGEGMTINVPLDTAAVINGSFPIDSAGYANLPVLGPLYVHNKPVHEVEKTIGTRLSKYLRDTHVMVTPVIRLTMIGHWQEPGMHYVNPEVSVWEACRAAGGPLTEANLLEWRVMRGSSETPVALLNEFSRGTTLRAAGIRSGDIFVIPTPDPESGFWYWFRETLTITTQIATIATTAMTVYLTWLTLENYETNQ